MFELLIQRNDVRTLEQLPFVFVQTFDLDIEQQWDSTVMWLWRAMYSHSLLFVAELYRLHFGLEVRIFWQTAQAVPAVPVPSASYRQIRRVIASASSGLAPKPAPRRDPFVTLMKRSGKHPGKVGQKVFAQSRLCSSATPLTLCDPSVARYAMRTPFERLSCNRDIRCRRS